MSDERPHFFPSPESFARIWTDFAAQMMKSGTIPFPEQSPPDAARQWRSAMFKSWSDYCDQFMRSAEFMEMMKQSLAASIAARRQLNEFLGNAQHELQGASRQDVDQIMLSLRHMERRMVDGTERLADQMKALTRRLDQLEKKLNDGGKKSRGGKDKSSGKATSN
jgi:hypothetical protein